MTSTVPPVAELIAPSHWRTVDCISDLHLVASEPATFAAWQRYMAETPADAVCILGDLFEVWVGDDAVAADPDGFDAACMEVLRAAARQRPVYFMHGNRDFLVGRAGLADCGVTLLDDPTVLQFAGQRWLLSHGDALCLDDTDYLQFRALVRSPQWQTEFLAKPLAERQQIARGIRSQSEQRKRSGAIYADVDTPAARDWLHAAQAPVLIHGHTHRPALHNLGDGLQRWVLSDWDLAATPPRGEALRLSAAGVQRLPLA
ncbi:UDP-2,3-diacylglucosamine hydrolase [Rhodoferax sp. OV413]|uniref:UDP-2,3-diacylglucosamine diphosphatase n=1 Tax=Rhodoferax sp. OV413 TaxID=1855285 RepID=UPI00088536C6|nr:UDP-2,3-diacylglucosamine diphosphatase [Rhodoferax sp. OV413]SDO01542.1 UDP-2,3-diacylglucosamine hydrolase [Rhodoferax sp. OV413]